MIATIMFSMLSLCVYIFKENVDMRLLDNIPFLIFVCVINLIPGIYGAIVDATGIARVITGTNLWLFFLSAARLLFIWYQREKFINESIRAEEAMSKEHVQDSTSDDPTKISFKN